MRFLQNRVKTFETLRDRGGDGFSKGRYEPTSADAALFTNGCLRKLRSFQQVEPPSRHTHCTYRICIIILAARPEAVQHLESR
jgi:hypothetical protein